MTAKIKVARDEALRDEIVELTHAVIAPPPKSTTNAPTQKSGVFDSDKKFVTASITFRLHGPFNSEPPYPDDAKIETLSGTYMFGGTMFGHFGHFLMETLARIWAVEKLSPKIDGIIFTPKTNDGNEEDMLKIQLPLIRAMGVGDNILLLTEPTRVQKLYVPFQGIGVGEGWEIATDTFRGYMSRFGGKNVNPKGAKKVYLSRSELPRQRASFLSELVLEKHLVYAGYEIVHPQKLSKENQIALYRSAEHIISPDGSPLHLLAYTGNPDQRIAVIARRSNDTKSIFESQLRAFLGAFAITADCLKHDWLPEGATRPGRTSWGEFDMPKLYDLLRDNRFIPANSPKWPEITEAEILAEVALIEKTEGVRYRRLIQK